MAHTNDADTFVADLLTAIVHPWIPIIRRGTTLANKRAATTIQSRNLATLVRRTRAPFDPDEDPAEAHTPANVRRALNLFQMWTVDMDDMIVDHLWLPSWDPLLDRICSDLANTVSQDEYNAMPVGSAGRQLFDIVIDAINLRYDKDTRKARAKKVYRVLIIAVHLLFGAAFIFISCQRLSVPLTGMEKCGGYVISAVLIAFAIGVIAQWWKRNGTAA